MIFSFLLIGFYFKVENRFPHLGKQRAQGIGQSADYREVLAEALLLLPEGGENAMHHFIHTGHDNADRIYEHGCDHIVMRFDDEFAKAFENIKIDLYERV